MLMAIGVASSAGCFTRAGFAHGGPNGDASRDGTADLARDDATIGDATGAICAAADLVLYWKLDEREGSRIVDSVGGNDGSWFDSVDDLLDDETTAGRAGRALRFGQGRYIVAAGFDLPAEGTFSAWVTSDFDETLTHGGAFPMLFDTLAPRTTLAFEADRGLYGLRTSGVDRRATFRPAADLSGWFHLVATWSATGAQLYLDGAPVGSASSGDARATSPPGLWLTTRPALDRWWDGLVDDVRVYGRALTAGEVAALYRCP